MGAALLKNYETAVDIITTLRRNLSIPVSCKLRLLDDTPKTLHLMKALEMAGACAIAVHMRCVCVVLAMTVVTPPYLLRNFYFLTREVHERPRHPAHWDRFVPLFQGNFQAWLERHVQERLLVRIWATSCTPLSWLVLLPLSVLLCLCPLRLHPTL